MTLSDIAQCCNEIYVRMQQIVLLACVTVGQLRRTQIWASEDIYTR